MLINICKICKTVGCRTVVCNVVIRKTRRIEITFDLHRFLWPDYCRLPVLVPLATHTLMLLFGANLGTKVELKKKMSASTYSLTLSACSLGSALRTIKNHIWKWTVFEKSGLMTNMQVFICYTQCAHLVGITCCCCSTGGAVSALAACSDLMGFEFLIGYFWGVWQDVVAPW